MRKTKIIATIGPTCMDYSILKAMVQNGLNIVRINLSHATIENMNTIYDNISKLRRELSVPLPIMLDTKGPEIRTKSFETGKIEIKKGQTFTFTGRDIMGNNEIVSLNEPKIIENIKVGYKILANNGLITFKVTDIIGQDVITKAMHSGIMSNHKSLSIPGLKLNTKYLNDADIKDLLWGIDHDCEFVAASFVNCKEDVLSLRQFLNEHNSKMKIISKIESALGVKNLDEIIEVSDGIMVARGDLGVEVHMSKLPQLQKLMIKKTNEAGKPVITATEMLESMIYNPRPTRAEVSDVSNAVYDGTGAVMLSGETANGKYPVEAVKQMANITLETEKSIDYSKWFSTNESSLKNTTDVISHSAVDASFLQKTKAMVVFTNTGESAKMVSKFKPSNVILGATPLPLTYRQLELSWGVFPILTPTFKSVDDMLKMANKYVKDYKLADTNDTIVITCGTPNEDGSTNLIKIQKVN